jgi:acetyl/propionyl-CoA carboxylase alpha subunit
VQIVGDQAGTVVHLFERECSIQRRYQKIIEEAPAPVVGPELRAELCEAAVAAGKAIGYVGAGTVEFVLDASGRFYFLEVNTRLQVEHPVTELITGIDLVRVQLEVAAGKPLPPRVTSATFTGHAIEARLYAEHALGGYLPVSGDLHTFEIEPADGLRVDAGFASGTTVSTHYDSMLAKVIGFGPTRDDARRTLAGALSRARLHGVVTNRDLLVAILREGEFAEGAIDTGYLDRHPPADLCAEPDETTLHTHALAAALAEQTARRATSPVLRTLPSGWRNNPSRAQQARYRLAGREITVDYRMDRVGLVANVDNTELAGLVLHAATPTEVDIEYAGRRRTIAVTMIGTMSYVDSAFGHTALARVDPFPDPSAAAQAGSLLAPMPGTVVRVEVAVGDRVEAGAPILAVEAMKMEHTIRAPGAGVIAGITVVAGQQVTSGSVLAVLDEERSDG